MRFNYASNEKAFYFTYSFRCGCDRLQGFFCTWFYTKHDNSEGHDDHSYERLRVVEILRAHKVLLCFHFGHYLGEECRTSLSNSFCKILFSRNSTTARLLSRLILPDSLKAPLFGSSDDRRASCGALIACAQTARAHECYSGDTRQLKRTKRARDGDGRSRFGDRDRRRRSDDRRGN